MSWHQGGRREQVPGPSLVGFGIRFARLNARRGEMPNVPRRYLIVVS